MTPTPLHEYEALRLALRTTTRTTPTPGTPQTTGPVVINREDIPMKTPEFNADDWLDKDPSREEVQALAEHIATRLPDTADQPEGAPRSQLHTNRLLLDIVLDREQNTHAMAAAAQAFSTGMEILRTLDYGNALGDVANNLLPAAMRLSRTAVRAQEGGCRLGGPGTCTGKDRVTIWIYDAFGHAPLDPGCILHTAEEARSSWDHGGEAEVVLVGSREATLETLRHLGGALTPTPRCCSRPPHLANREGNPRG
ncbi:hypothetical protein [Streptomyces sp. CS014]|uniref:hypothetical protein n=1 Tax=Streptomyces sp. CS014 TaxID=2162707 RepID=UPI000D51FF14|nr:hypothetical protein [Streptomyces sp. CS014]PVD04449.1 hypothetical protein DBP12_03220 [Streptomyces sp. CS014]